jgi:hypothetical protein
VIDEFVIVGTPSQAVWSVKPRAIVTAPDVPRLTPDNVTVVVDAAPEAPGSAMYEGLAETRPYAVTVKRAAEVELPPSVELVTVIV